MNQNPYEPPRSDATRSAITYYRLVTTKLRLRECQRISTNWSELFVLFWLRLLYIRLPMPFAIADVRHFQRVSPGDLTVRASANIKPVADQALALNLRYGFSYSLPTIGTTELVTAIFLSDDSDSFLQIEYARTWTKIAASEKTMFAFVSRLADGRFIVTHGGKGDLDVPPHILREVHTGKPMRQVFTRHMERLRGAGSRIVRMNDPNELELMVREHEHAFFTYAIGRGVLTPVSHRDIERLQRAAVGTPQAPRFAVTFRFQGIEIICWITLLLALTMFSQDQPANAPQLLLRTSILFVAGLGIAIIWVFRCAMWIQRKADEHH